MSSLLSLFWDVVILITIIFLFGLFGLFDLGPGAAVLFYQ